MRQAETSVTNALAGVVPGTIARLLPDRMALVRIFRFGISGGVATGVHVALAMLLITGCSATQVEANGVAFVCANVCSYLLNALWAFSVRPGRDNFLRFFCVSVFGLLLTLAISWAAQKVGANYWTGLAVILATVPPITFVLHRFWTFR
ncbi:GtrA family protein [Ralstonia pseudosolanacearum]|uniref:GtrA family protein n=1 Tax=Ralstonia solanacearum TaxID=305 RepID=A0AA92JV78_RALSL|nr:GtrA family protein [Ralstonia pseudosolanacearum]QOK93460.1 GtrA family protein [Ralstonia pseudosolanacearum]QOK98366.1 GtrA family protein [Ralstonia pseudosolanacearum]UWD92712.1 GtrA family protein [Ralstonia pseudosolanacearum]